MPEPIPSVAGGNPEEVRAVDDVMARVLADEIPWPVEYHSDVEQGDRLRIELEAEVQAVTPQRVVMLPKRVVRARVVHTADGRSR